MSRKSNEMEYIILFSETTQLIAKHPGALLFLWWNRSKKSIEMEYNILFSETTQLIAKHPWRCAFVPMVEQAGVKNLLKWDIINL